MAVPPSNSENSSRMNEVRERQRFSESSVIIRIEMPLIEGIKRKRTDVVIIA